MRNLTLTATALFIGLNAFSTQGLAGTADNLNYEVHGRYSRSIKKEKLNKAKFLSDVISDYPSSWILEYVSVEITATCNGKAIKAATPNDALSAEQINILNTADLATDVVINVTYKSKNPVTDLIEKNRMDVSLTVIPEVEAAYFGGEDKMKMYLNENGIHNISKTIPKKFQQVVVRFTVNEDGEIVNAKVFKTSGDAQADKLFLETISKMPKWSPAVDSKGVKVKQEFEFSLGQGGC